MNFEKVKKQLGFGCMRLPMQGSEVDYTEFTKMIDAFMSRGFNYFDTASVYIEGKSEIALKTCLVNRYPRDQFVYTNKLSSSLFQTEADIRPLFERQLQTCGLTYFDFYLMHAQNKDNYQKYKQTRAYETAYALKAEGKIKHVGLSFHDKAEVLDMILTEQPQIEAVQIQFNYLDTEDPQIQSRLCYEVCRKHHKPIIVMEPVKGGSLVHIPPKAQALFDQLGSYSYASYAIRYAASFEGVMMVLSGMSNYDQMKDNLSYMNDFQPLSKQEYSIIQQVKDIIKRANTIPCTSCRYCVEGCPKQIDIPGIFTCLNAINSQQDANVKEDYRAYTFQKGKAKDCISCGKCEKTCPQHLEIRKLLKKASWYLDE